MLIPYISGNIRNTTPTKLTLIADNKTDKTNIKLTNCRLFYLITDKTSDKTLQTTDKKLYVSGYIKLAILRCPTLSNRR